MVFITEAVFTARYELNRYVFCVYLRTNSDYFLMQHRLIGFYNRDSVHYAVRSESLCVLCVSQNKQRLFLYTALTEWFL